MKNILKNTLINSYKLLKPPCRRGQKETFLPLRTSYKLLKPPCRRGQKETFLPLRTSYKLLKPPCRRGQKETFLPLRTSYKLLKLLRNFTPPPPPALRHKQGFGLVETLVAAGVGSILLYGVLRTAHMSVQTAQISTTIQAENDLSITLKQLLTNEEDCKWNLRPSNLSDTSNKKGKLRESWKKTNGNNFDTPSDDTLKEDDVPILSPGDFKNGLLSIKSLELLKKEGTATAPPTYTFVVFYTKPQAGAYETRGAEPCDPTASPPKKAGCYVKDCQLTLTHHSDNSIDKCSPSSHCRLGEGMDMSCENGYLKGFKANGDKECIEFCPEGEVITGVEIKEEKAEPKCAKMITLPKDPDDDETYSNLECTGDLLLQGFDEDGNPMCKKACLGGRIWDDTLSDCVCTDSTKTWDGVACR